MPTYVFEFTAATSDVTQWKEIPLTYGDGSYSHTSLGDQLIAISATTTFGASLESQLELDWVEGSNTTTGTTLGVFKEAVVTITADGRRTGLNNSSGGYVNTVFISPEDDYHNRTVGIGPMRDFRVSPINLRNAKLYIGCTNLGGSGTLTVYVTTSRIL